MKVSLFMTKKNGGLQVSLIQIYVTMEQSTKQMNEESASATHVKVA